MLKLNNKGEWGFRVMAFFCCVFVIMLLIVVGKISNISKKLSNNTVSETKKEEKQITNNELKTKEYQILENDVKQATVEYINKYYSDLGEDEIITITVKNMLKEEMLKTSLVNNIKCSGYGKYKNTKEIIVNSYIKCKNKYTTVGYEKIFDNE